MRCRICNSKKLTLFLDLGFTPPADDFLVESRLKEPEIHYPLEVYICDECSLVQLGYVVAPEILYQKDYPYESSLTKTGVRHFHAFAKDVYEEFELSPDDLAVDIGSNVGVLLEGFKKVGSRVLGVEPAANIARIALKRGIDTINEFFTEESVRKIIAGYGKAKVVTATNVFAHVDDIRSFAKTLDKLLTDKGVFIFEAPYLAELLKNIEYDTIYHEHLSYISVKPLMRLFDDFGMRIFNIQRKDIHGGSLRYFISRSGDYRVSKNLQEFIDLEKDKKIHDIKTLKRFTARVSENRRELMRLLWSLKYSGKRIVGVGAPAKGMTLLNYCGIGTGLLDFITEKSNLKIGKFTPGLHIPVYPDSALLAQKPDFALLLAWNFKEEIMANLKDYVKTGGRFIIPIPKPRIIN